jgi:hypothetical protein
LPFSKKGATDELKISRHTSAKRSMHDFKREIVSYASKGAPQIFVWNVIGPGRVKT